MPNIQIDIGQIKGHPHGASFRDKFRRHELEGDIYRCPSLIHVSEICLWNTPSCGCPFWGHWFTLSLKAWGQTMEGSFFTNLSSWYFTASAPPWVLIEHRNCYSLLRTTLLLSSRSEAIIIGKRSRPAVNAVGINQRKKQVVWCKGKIIV